MRELLWRQLLINCFQPGEQRARGRQASVSRAGDASSLAQSAQRSYLEYLRPGCGCHMPAEMTKVHSLHRDLDERHLVTSPTQKAGWEDPPAPTCPLLRAGRFHKQNLPPDPETELNLERGEGDTWLF